MNDSAVEALKDNQELVRQRLEERDLGGTSEASDLQGARELAPGMPKVWHQGRDLVIRRFEFMCRELNP